jgi:hypothetical protein
MASPDLDRIAELERQVRELRLRVIALERLLGTTAAEHPSDRSTVERKAVYDWQA